MDSLVNLSWPVTQTGLVAACSNGKIIKEYPWASGPSSGGQSNNSVMKQQPDAVHDVLQHAEDITLPRAVK